MGGGTSSYGHVSGKTTYDFLDNRGSITLEGFDGRGTEVKYYSEKEMGSLRAAFEARVLGWQQVTVRKMFGCPCYKADGKLFAFLVTDGLVITRLSRSEKEALSHLHRTTFFKAGNKTVRSWMEVPAKSVEDFDRLMRYVRKSYEAALRGA